MKIQLIFNNQSAGDLIDASDDYDQLEQFAYSAFKGFLAEPFQFFYNDSEGDIITVSDCDDLKVLLNQANEKVEGQDIRKLVIASNIEEATQRMWGRNDDNHSLKDVEPEQDNVPSQKLNANNNFDDDTSHHEDGGYRYAMQVIDDAERQRNNERIDVEFTEEQKISPEKEKETDQEKSERLLSKIKALNEEVLEEQFSDHRLKEIAHELKEFQPEKSEFELVKSIEGDHSHIEVNENIKEDKGQATTEEANKLYVINIGQKYEDKQLVPDEKSEQEESKDDEMMFDEQVEALLQGHHKKRNSTQMIRMETQMKRMDSNDSSNEEAMQANNETFTTIQRKNTDNWEADFKDVDVTTIQSGAMFIAGEHITQVLNAQDKSKAKLEEQKVKIDDQQMDQMMVAKSKKESKQKGYYNAEPLNSIVMLKQASFNLEEVVREEKKQQDFEMITNSIVEINRDQNQQKENALHFGKACSVCGTNPIRGIRYRCYECPNLEFCQKCEAKSDHSDTHALIKIKNPDCDPFKVSETPKEPKQEEERKSIPIATPEPVKVEARIDYQAKFVKENPPKGYTVLPGQTFEKSWTLRNSGQVAWPEDIKLCLSDGLSFGDDEISINQVVKPGCYCEVIAKFKAPEDLGKYHCQYSLFYTHDEEKIKFGDTVFCDINVKYPDPIDDEDDLGFISREANKIKYSVYEKQPRYDLNNHASIYDQFQQQKPINSISQFDNQINYHANNQPYYYQQQVEQPGELSPILKSNNNNNMIKERSFQQECQGNDSNYNPMQASGIYSRLDTSQSFYDQSMYDSRAVQADREDNESVKKIVLELKEMGCEVNYEKAQLLIQKYGEDMNKIVDELLNE